MKINRKLKEAGLSSIVERYVRAYPELKTIAFRSSKGFTDNALMREMPSNVWASEDWKLALFSTEPDYHEFGDIDDNEESNGDEEPSEEEINYYWSKVDEYFNDPMTSR